MLDKIEKRLIDSAIRIVKGGEGCLYVIQIGELSYEPLIKNDLDKFSIMEDAQQKRMDILAKTDGACIINQEGELIAYGQKINETKSFEGYGTRNSAAFSASLLGNISIMGSQEQKKVKIFKQGGIVMQIDCLEKDVEKNTDKAVSLLSSIGIGTIGAIGTSLAIPALGVMLIPGIIIFSGSHYLINLLKNKELK